MKGLHTSGRRLAVALFCTFGAVLASSAAQAGSTTKVGYSADAYGSMVKVGHVIRSDPTFRAGLSACAAKPGDHSANSGATTSVATLLRSGTVSNFAAAARSGAPTVTATSITHSASVLGGLIQASVVKARSRVTYTGSHFRFADGSHLARLSVAGNSVTVHANVRITLRHLGYVIVHERSRKIANGRAYQIINMIHVVVTIAGNKYGLSPGANIIVGHSVAALTPHLPGGSVLGGAYGSHAQVGRTAMSGYSANVNLPCLGGSVSNTTAGTSLKAATTATVSDAGSSRVSPTASSGNLSSIVHGAKLLGGLIRATVVHASISGSFNGATHSFADRSTFTDLTVRGLHVSVHPNKVINLGFATLYLHRVIRTNRSLTVRMIGLVVKGTNVYGLKTGTDIQVAVTHLGFRS